MWNWVRAFKGDYKLLRTLDPSNIQGELEKYDIVHVNLSGDDTALPGLLRNKLGRSSTKLICNMDYNIENFQRHVLGAGYTIHDLVSSFLSSDLVFAQEPFQQSFVQYIIDEDAALAEAAGKPSKRMNVPLIPHPINMDLKKKAVPSDQRLEILLIDFHRYDNQLLVPSLLTRALPIINGLAPNVIIGGYTGEVNIFGIKDKLFDGAMDYTDWGQFVYLLMNSCWGLSYYSIHSHDRFAAEAACLKVPTVTTRNSYYGTVLWPDLCKEMTDLKGLREALKRIITDDKFYEETAEKAFAAVEAFNFERSIEKLEVALGLR